jgi:hypothetical protein
VRAGAFHLLWRRRSDASPLASQMRCHRTNGCS